MPVADLIRYMAEPINIVKFKNQKKKKKRRAPFSLTQVEMRVDCPALHGKEC